ncbi:MAG TPA: hypothetical protein VKZ79_11470 [Alphaproteobacteria bacterium]|nr:hypothetical protein [Alphaproteobacteria bacterium]
MSSSYAERKLEQALLECGGSPSVARRLVMGWASKDPRLLQELAQPFLTGIVGHAVDRAIKRQPKGRPQPKPGALGTAALDGIIRALGQNFDRGDPVRAEPSCAAHADVIRGLAKAQVRKRALAFDHASSARR